MSRRCINEMIHSTHSLLLSLIKMHFLLRFFCFPINARPDFWAQNVGNLKLDSLVWSISHSTETAIKQLPPFKCSRLLKFCLISSQSLALIFVKNARFVQKSEKKITFWARFVQKQRVQQLQSILPSKSCTKLRERRFLKFCLILSQCLFSIFLIAKTCVSVKNPSKNQCYIHIRANGPWQSNLRSVMMSERIFKLATMNCNISWSSDRCLAALVLMMRNRLLFCVPFCFRFVCEHIESVSIVSTVHSD